MENWMNNNCPGCRRACALFAPACERGEIFVKTGVLPEEGSHPCGRGGGRRGGRGERRGPHRPRMSREQYESLPIEEKLFFHLHGLMHIGKPGGGRGGQGRVLAILAQRGALSQRELMDMIGMQSGSLSELLGKLETAGFVQRTPSQTDRRSMDVRITEDGKAAAEQAQKAFGERRAQLFDCLTDAEKETLLALMEKLAAAREQTPACTEAGDCEGHGTHRHGPEDRGGRQGRRGDRRR